MLARLITLGLLLLWVIAVALSYALSTALDGPRNLETGFKRLDTLLLWQAVAFVIALAAMVAAWAGRPRPRIVRLLGFAPITLTAVAILALVVVLSLEPQSLTGPSAVGGAVPTAPAPDLSVPSSDGS
ncbi:MAG: hypothetical protein AAF666_14400 [Pseudomonadota bacterium]